MTMQVTGVWETRIVTINDIVLSPEASQQVWNHSPNGFSWGYDGSGSAQLALALLLEGGLDDEAAVRYHQAFMRQVIALLPQADFTMEVDLLAWLGEAGPVNTDI
jgi:hypothetical protein